MANGHSVVTVENNREDMWMFSFSIWNKKNTTENKYSASIGDTYIS